LKKLRQGNIKNSGEFCNILQSYIPFPSFDLSDVGSVESAFFRQFLLAQMNPGSIKSNGSSELSEQLVTHTPRLSRSRYRIQQTEGSK
jgi:hypothetical protein